MDLISSKREGEYWDFKECHHKNKADLLHDIICMANNRTDQDGFIIFGVNDHFEIKGIAYDENRKSQQQMIDFLKSKSFSGGIKPTIELHTILFQDMEIDVLIVKDSDDTPFFLTKSDSHGKRRVRDHYIYTRIGDTNTDIDKSADINHVEYLWKKRFQINRSPLDQIKYQLQSFKEWQEKSDENTIYHEFNPEFTLHFNYDEEAEQKEFYSYLMMNDTTIFGSLKVRYFALTLWSHQFAVLDGGRYRTTVPDWGSIQKDTLGDRTVLYKYYVKGSMNYLLHQLLTGQDHESLIAKRRLYEVVTLFESELEKELFEEYVTSNLSLLENCIETEEKRKSYDGLGIESVHEKQHTAQRIKEGKAMKQMLNHFRGMNNQLL